MTFAKLFYEIWESSKGKLKNPLTSTFLVALIIFNWKALSIFFFSVDSIEERIDIINEHHSGWDKVYIPLVIAIAYQITLKYAMWLSDILSRFAIVGRSKLVAFQTIKRLRGQRHVETLKFEITKIKSGIKENDELRKQNDELKSSRDRIQVELNRLTESSSAEATRLNTELNTLRSDLSNTARELIVSRTRTEKLLEIAQVNGIAKDLSSAELDKFIQYCDFYISGRNKDTFSIDIILEEKFYDLKLLRRDSTGAPEWTNRGRILYDVYSIK